MLESCVALVSHHEYQLSTCSYVAVSDIPFVVRRPVEDDALDVAVGVAVVLCGYSEGYITACRVPTDLDFRLIKQRTSEPVTSGCRLYLIES